jgi:hypothetical protein
MQLLITTRQHLMQVIRVFAPQAFSQGSTEPDIYVLADRATLPNALVDPTLTLVELQLLVAKRADAVWKELSMRLERHHQGGEQQQDRQQPQGGVHGPMHSAVTVSTDNSSDADLVETLE